MKKLLIGGSPCTHWSIAQKNNRETTAEGLGWELFKNFLIAKEKFKPDFFLYENNKSMAKAIKEQITKELGVEPILINSALVSAQNRQRYYWTNIPSVEQPKDRGILLRDILESGTEWQEKSYCLTTRCNGATPKDTLEKNRHTMVAEPVKPSTVINVNPSGKGINGNVVHVNGKSLTLTTNKGEGPKIIEPVALNDQEGKSRTVKAQYAKTSIANLNYSASYGATMVAEPVTGRMVGRRINEQGKRDDYNENLKHIQRFEVNENPQKTNVLTTVQKDNMVAVPVEELTPFVEGKLQNIVNKFGCLPEQFNAYNLAETKDKTPTITACSNRQSNSGQVMSILKAKEKQEPVYEVKDGMIAIKGKSYPIKLVDGYYIIRKLTPVECERLQTMPDGFTRVVSNTQRYKGLGNGWTAEVIIHILKHANIPLDEELQILSMYDGIATGRYCLDKMGYKNVTYTAYEIDKYAIQIAMSNYPDIIQKGDAFQVREEGWSI